MTSLAHKSYADLLLRLPRELRDLIYPHVVAEDDPIHLDSIDPDSFTQPFQINPAIATEALEAYYKYNAFTITFKHEVPPTETSVPNPNWGPHPSIAKSQIRNLTILATEAGTVAETKPTDYENNHWNNSDRLRWTHLLRLPKLEILTIKMQKFNDDVFVWQDFSPILGALSAGNPTLLIVFQISFDLILEQEWNNEWWAGFPQISSGNKYLFMDYIDVTHLFAVDRGERLGVFGVPAEEDRQYVKEWLPDRVMPKGRSVKAGLLDDTPAQRRNLGEHYVVKEPALMRVLMEEQFEAYKECERIRNTRVKDTSLT